VFERVKNPSQLQLPKFEESDFAEPVAEEVTA
jgi:hypothetical protein